MILLVCFFNCKQEVVHKTETIKEEVLVVNTDSIVKINSPKPKEKQTKQRFYVSANSGLNYRDQPNGKILGKIEINTPITIAKKSGVFETIKDFEKEIKGEWVGIYKGNDTVYVFDAFLSKNKVNGEFQYVQPKLKDSTLTILSLHGYERQQNKWSYFLALADNPNDYLYNPEKLDDETYTAFNKEERLKFFKTNKINQLDTVFVYSINKIYKLVVKDLGVVSVPDGYGSGFRVGLDLHGKVKNVEFAYLGKENPFIEKQLMPIVWNKIDKKSVPNSFNKQSIHSSYRWWYNDVELVNSYKYSNKEFDFYLQELKRNYSKDYYLVIIDSKTKEFVLENLYSDSESTSPASLSFVNINNKKQDGYKHEQWTGYLFKDKPPVVFGFQYHSFGCPSINFIETPKTYVPIYCDNRH
ncbi:hypothetical protein [Olleya sp. R77988]|uniref:hypothetical protein n=1 Tax=Olleya sp. R77988 TaxID=3093875 RepID=UPI0037C75BB4